MSVFRVLFVDDDVAKGLEKVSSWTARASLVASAQRSHALYPVRQIIEEAKESAATRLHLYVARDLRFEHESSVTFTFPETIPALGLELPLHGLILDLAGPTLREDLALSTDDLPAANSDELKELNEVYPGAAFFLKRLARLRTSNCRVFMLTSHVDQTGVLPRFVFGPHCWPQGSARDVGALLFSAEKGDQIERLASTLVAKFRAFDRGFTFQRQLGDVEFAASHDEPVLVVGESGTSKESIAREIHDQWQRRKASRLPFAVVNCGGLSPELAQSELFGHVKGSFTGADNQRMGRIVTLCASRSEEHREVEGSPASAEAGLLRAAMTGLADIKQALDREDIPAAKKAFSDGGGKALIACLSREFLDKLKSGVDACERRVAAATSGKDHVAGFQRLLRSLGFEADPANPNGYDMTIGPSAGASGTLFLDEFGELPAYVQTLLLRFLSRDGEVQPLGYPGVIRGTSVRLICATSDPRVAAFAGETLSGAWRSLSELERPLRQDLLFRVKGQVIRATPITRSNIDEVIRHFVELQAEAGGPKWSGEARACLSGELRALLDRVERASSSGGEENRPAFGHFREVDQIFRLASHLYNGAKDRGLYPPPEVTEQSVRLLWRASRLDADSSRTGVSQLRADHSTTGSLENWFLTQIRTVQREDASAWLNCGERFEEETREWFRNNGGKWRACLLRACLTAGSTAVTNKFGIGRDHIWAKVLTPLMSPAAVAFFRKEKGASKAEVIKFVKDRMRAMSRDAEPHDPAARAAWVAAREAYPGDAPDP